MDNKKICQTNQPRMPSEKLRTIRPIECSLPNIKPVESQKKAKRKHERAPIPSIT